MFDSNSGGGTTNPTTENPATEPNETNPLESLVGEGKKFRDVAALVKSLQHKDEFIEQLKSENNDLRSEVKSRTKLEEAIDRIRSLESNYKPKEENEEDNPRTTTSKEVDPEKIAQMAIKHLEARQAEERKKQNAENVKKELVNLFGEGGYEVALREKMKELNLTEEYVTRLAQDTPQLLIDYFRKSAPQRNAPQGTPGSQVNDGFFQNSQQTTKRNYKYYEKMKKTNPDQYTSSKVQWQMHQDAQKMGPAFFE
jgi:hypothetical protein